MRTRTRQFMIVAAFAATVAAGITGATLRGETKENSIAELCETATWPMIPAHCLDGNAAVRTVSAETQAQETRLAANAMAERFNVAFQ